MQSSKIPTETWDPLGLRAWEGHPATMDYSHRHNDLELNLVTRGSVSYFSGGRRFVIPERTLVLFWAIAPHQLTESRDGTQMYWMTLPLAWFLHQNWPDRFYKAVLNAQLVYDQQVSEQDPQRFQQWQQDLSRNTAQDREVVYLEVEARLKRMAYAMETSARTQFPAPLVTAGHHQSQAEKMAGYLAEHYLEDVSIEQVAGIVGLHPNYAMNVFRKSYGQTMIAYLTQCRIAHAQQLLVTTNHNVVQIALESGFGSVSQFYSAFHKQCGMSPKAYRESLR